MNKLEFINAIASKTGLMKKDVRKIVKTYHEVVKEAMENKEVIEMLNYGTFYALEQSERVARNPKSGVEVVIKPRTTVRFKPSKHLIKSIND